MSASTADIGDEATFMWNVAALPRTAPVRPADDLGHRDAGQHVDAWKHVAPTVVTGAISPMSVTGTISTGTPASTQSIRFWQESSEYRKLPVAVIVKIDIGRAMRSARSAWKSCIISTIRGTPRAR